ncbi:hypothetical protein E6P09_07380 [Haloferax mediterranei ATCC 33500]|uniref:Uncharacterized protein n=1 Tax=Haloferax mediterranei (strain ATCC 33500 / DSM 1411 / JCM 8866 / NBRC 14739 / NCIMB 2177 / R-4) TaxID=523841 RepID=I3R2Y2_HALMT|nr:hypothetical protein [Haloferax mediterranei]AFK18592.1 hypothetical protein HFX_0871 [Haloferax mediterranei ATCC 33500]AHZ22034.1 hypothetical protein BM92_04875 [Haloferax mediterranei ATCC 33500]EMA02133.1 hypothetical protein C439_06120 [Haloferax mediterranei ATCC 33500]MDX5988681.1 hypothetical protein [Haloferax mediterranei ATCC 33500]QCQ75092.1 hypothetical protein E6P09_07380 [Haloferax mediterranei ATCC 33500]
MALSDYTGQSPTGREDTIVRVVPHRLWRPGDERIEPCAYSGEDIRLSEKHLLVVLERDGVRERMYFRDERSLAAWLEENER